MIVLPVLTSALFLSLSLKVTVTGDVVGLTRPIFVRKPAVVFRFRSTPAFFAEDGSIGGTSWPVVPDAHALLAVAYWTPQHHLGLPYLLPAPRLQHVTLAEWAPA